jgi:hypothetical protein
VFCSIPDFMVARFCSAWGILRKEDRPLKDTDPLLGARTSRPHQSAQREDGWDT